MTDRTRGKRPDYKKLHTTGEIVLKDRSPKRGISVDAGESKEKDNESNGACVSVSKDYSYSTDDYLSTSEVLNEDQVDPFFQIDSFQEYRDHNQVFLSVSDQSCTQSEYSDEEADRISESSQFSDATVMTEMEQLQSLMNQLTIQESSLAEDIDDFLDENVIEDIAYSIEDLDDVIRKTEDLRSAYRGKHKELKSSYGDAYEAKFEDSYNDRMGKIKDHLKEARGQRLLLRKDEGQAKTDKNDAKVRKLKFLKDGIERTLKQLSEVFSIKIDGISDEEIVKRRADFSRQQGDLQSALKMIQDYMETGALREEADAVSKMYEKTIQLKDEYIKALDAELSTREIEKRKTFKTSSLNINLPRFRDYESSLDIYTFQDQFNKLYQKDYPRTVLPDFLKNNFLDNPAKLLVKDVQDIDDIWKRLKDAYGDHRIMMSKKLKELTKFESSWRPNDATKTVEVLSKVVNLMRDLMQLAERHNIENNLYYGDALDRIYRIMGDGRLTRWLSSTSEGVEGKVLWSQLITFLEKDIKIYQQKAVILTKSNASKDQRSKDNGKDKYKRDQQSFHSGEAEDVTRENPTEEGNLKCYICGETNHVQTNGPGGIKLVQYFVCPKFVQMKPSERFQFIKSKGYCVQCLYPGAKETGKHKEGRCQRDFVCRNREHNKFPNKKHVLICDEHKDDDENKATLQKFKERHILRQRHVPEFAKNIQVSHYCEPDANGRNCDENAASENGNQNILGQSNISHTSYPSSKEEENKRDESAIYLLQTIKVGHHFFNLFYDNGCGDFISRYNAVLRLGDNAVPGIPGPLTIGGVGNIKTVSKHGTYDVKLPLGDGDDVATMTGVCLDQITQTFPNYPLQGKVEEDIRVAYNNMGGNLTKLPLLPMCVGGDTDFMIGVKYLRYFPQEIFKMPSGLTIFKSHFKNPDGSYGVIGGPHRIFTEIEKQHHLCSLSFFSTQMEIFRSGYQVNPDITLLGYKEDDLFSEPSNYPNHECDVFKSNMKNFQEAEEVGSNIQYRCVNCRGCPECKNYENDGNLSIKEEVEQDLINKSVTTDIEKKETIASMPLISDPKVKLAPNRSKALKVYNQQLKAIERCIEDKAKVIEAEKKLQDLGFVEFVNNLPKKIQQILLEHLVQNFIPWRVVWKEDSVTSPLRLVFDGRYPTESGFSINDIVAKGKNSLNKLIEIFIRWRTKPFAFHNDVTKMYNAIKLREEDWCLQRYLWQEDLDPSKPPVEKVIKTLIYGVRSSGNQAERAIRQVAEISKDEYPQVHDLIQQDTYVDDILTGAECDRKAHNLMDELEIVLARGGFSLKGFTMSGQDPLESLSNDGESIYVAGHKWFPKKDQISLNIKDLNFARKQRGRKTKIIYEIPNEFKAIWASHFEMMAEIKNIRFHRAVVPDDAVNLDAETIDFGDASHVLACAAIYIRFKKKDGTYSCQLIFARSRLVPEDMSQPRGELFAAVINTHAGEVVRRSLQNHHTKSIKISDSQIVLHWICNIEKSLEVWVRNRVIEIQRFTDLSNWKFVRSKDNIADIGTRRCSSIEVVNPDSIWMNGFQWMRGDEKNFPMVNVEDLNTTKIQENSDSNISRTPDPSVMNKSSNEIKKQDQFLAANSTSFKTQTSNSSSDISKVQERYVFSQYVIDPNRRRFSLIIRILALVFTFITNARKKSGIKSRVTKYFSNGVSKLIISENMIERAKHYFSKKATAEVKKFVKPGEYRKLADEVDGILIYTGRILSSSDVTIVGKATQVMKDLTQTTFNVPVVDRYSPIAYSVVNDIHWHHKTVQHCGCETIWRYVLQEVFIIDGRSLIKKINKNCERCRYLNKKTLEVTMGPVSKYNLMIAPSFYVSQVDLAGPFQAFSAHNKRATIKIWLLVFCCATTSAVSIKVMEDYSTVAFIQGFIRFACEVGYPKKLLIDEGSQLIKGCESMELSFWDCKFQLHKEYQVDYEVCPVGGHNYNGRVERMIREVRKSISKSLTNTRLSIIQWETMSAIIANSINNLPLALGNEKADLEFLDLITPNRLKLGRNNERSPEGNFIVTDFKSKLKDNEAIFNAWFEVWLSSHVPKLMNQSKWFKSSRSLQKGDVVLFLKEEAKMSSKYQFGMIESAEKGRDGEIRKARVKYRNHNEKVTRVTHRAVRSLVLIRHVDEMNIIEELGEVSRLVENMRSSEESFKCNLHVGGVSRQRSVRFSLPHEIIN